MKLFTSNTLARNSLIVFAGGMVSNIGSYLYHLLTGRILGPTGYGELASLISLLYIFGVPTTVLSTVLVKYFSQCKAADSPGEAKDLYLKMVGILAKISIVFFFVFLALSPFIGSFLHLSASSSLIWLCIGFILSIFTTVNGSVLQGFQMFVWVAVFTASAVFIKLLISTPLAFWGVEWAVIGSTIAATIVLLLFFYPIRFIFSAVRKQFPLTKRSIVRFSIPTFITLLGLTSLYSFDIVLARHFLTASESGLYSAIATLGKVIFYASSAVVTVLFPVLSERTARQEPPGNILGIALGLVGIISLCVTLAYIIFPTTVIQLLFGPSYFEGAQYLGLFAIFISLYSLGNVFVLACLALNRLWIWTVTAGAAAIQILCICLFHSSIAAIITVNISVTLLLVISAGIYYYVAGKHIKTGL